MKRYLFLAATSAGTAFFVFGATDGVVMIHININDQEHVWTKTSGSWIQGRIRELEQNGIAVCVKVHIKCGDVDVGLSAGECPPGGWGGRKPTAQEQELMDAWEKASASLNGGNIHSFLQRVSREHCEKG